jgi:hypothetical protein
MWSRIVERLNSGEIVEINPKGGSMTPLILSGQSVEIWPIADHAALKVGDVVLAKVKGRFYLHLISAIAHDRIQISNNHGHVNGWTDISKIYGWVNI